MWIRPYPVLCLDGDGVFCKPCGKAISATKKHLIDQHCSTSLHKRNCQKKDSSSTSQTSIRQAMSGSGNSTRDGEDPFKFDLCKAMLASNIPLYKLNNPSFKGFLEKYCKKSIPDESTLRKKTVDKCYIETIAKIKARLENNFMYIVVDETTDVCGRYMANLLIGCLSENSPSKPFLVAVKELDKTNSNTISRFIQESLTNIFLPNAPPMDKVVLMLTDAAAYMVKAGKNLKIFYPNLIHCTCLAHGINRVAEEIRDQFPLVNDLINNMKKVFVKAPLRVQIYRETLLNVPLPPKPVITRWGTWLEAAIFYFQYFKEMKEIMEKFDGESLAAIKNAQTILNDPKIKQQLNFIQSNYEIIIETISKLERQGVLLNESVKLINKIKKNVSESQGAIARHISKKMDDVLGKNEGFRTLSLVSKALDGEFSDELTVADPKILPCLKYAPITSVDVERSSSLYKYTLSDRRQSFKTENLEKHLIISANETIFINEM